MSFSKGESSKIFILTASFQKVAFEEVMFSLAMEYWFSIIMVGQITAISWTIISRKLSAYFPAGVAVFSISLSISGAKNGSLILVPGDLISITLTLQRGRMRLLNFISRECQTNPPHSETTHPLKAQGFWRESKAAKRQPHHPTKILPLPFLTV
jgi:hypothetical protein